MDSYEKLCTGKRPQQGTVLETMNPSSLESRGSWGGTAQRPREENFREQQPKDTVSCSVAMGTHPRRKEVTEVKVPCLPSCPSLVDARLGIHRR